MDNDIAIGRTGTATIIVTETNIASAVGSGNLAVFATPMMVALMEQAACAVLTGCLGPGQTSVGTKISVEHTAASPPKMEIAATATITAIHGHTIDFNVSASDAAGEIGKGTHTRVIVDAERLMAKTQTRLKSE